MNGSINFGLASNAIVAIGRLINRNNYKKNVNVSLTG